MAQKYYKINGGTASIQRLITTCKLTHTTVKAGWWSMTQMTPQDAVTYGLCVANGTAAGPKWTDWVLKTMREVRGTVDKQPADQKTGGGRWGIIDALPWNLAPEASIKNGWTLTSHGLWHVNCLGIHPDWILAVMTHYERKLQLAYGGRNLRAVTRQALILPAEPDRVLTG